MSKNYAFWHACRIGDLDSMRKLVDQVNVNHEVDGTTGLWQACYHAKPAAVAFLLSRPDVRVNARGANGTTAFMQTISKRREDIMNFYMLLRHPQTDASLSDKRDLTALLVAAGGVGMVHHVEGMIASGKDLNPHQTCKLGPEAILTALDAAICVGLTDTAMLLCRYFRNPRRTTQAMREQCGSATFPFACPFDP